MKFGKQFDFHKIPEWSEYYFDYKTLKDTLKMFDKKYRSKISKIKKFKKALFKNFLPSKIENNDKIVQHHQLNESLVVKSVTIRAKSSQYERKLENNSENNTQHMPEESETTEIHDDFNMEENTKHFIAIYNQKVRIIEKFFLQKLNEFSVDFENLRIKMNNKRSSIMNSVSLKEFEKMNETMRNCKIRENAERDELGYAVSWKRAISQLYNLTSWLHSFSVINSIALQKITKKGIKIFGKHGPNTFEQEISQINNCLSFLTNIQLIVDIRKQIKQVYAMEFTEGDLSKATRQLEERLHGNRSKHTALISFYSGAIVSSIISLILLQFIPISSTKNPSMDVFFPAFSFTFVIILLILGLGLNIIVLRRFRINYIYIFEIDPKLRLGHNEIFKNGLFLLAIWILLFLLTNLSLSFDLFYGYFYIFSLSTICFTIVFLLFPFHCAYYEFRKGIIMTLVKNLFPLGKKGVRFRDFMFGDILTSLTKPFASLVISFCLFSCPLCRDNNNVGSCKRSDSVGCFIIMLMPFVIRFFQCLNRFYYTKMAWPHLGNTLKYTGGMANVIFAWLFGKFGDDLRLCYIIVACVATSYMLFWDIYMDWNLGRFTSVNFFLRDKIVYPKYMYYGVIIINAILRFTWVTNLFDPPINKELLFFILSILEAYRRIQWSLFRIENENTNNPEKYRAILDIPDLTLD